MRLDALGSFTGPRDLGTGVVWLRSRLRYPPRRNTSVRRAPRAIMIQSLSLREVLGSGSSFTFGRWFHGQFSHAKMSGSITQVLLRVRLSV